MEQGLKHIHYLFIGVFLLSYLIKCILFLLDKKEAFANYKKKTILIETLFAVGFIATGVMMIINNQKASAGEWLSNSGWFHLKLTLVVLAIPLGIVGFKKDKKVLILLSFLFFTYVFLIALPQTRGTFMFF